MLIAAVINEKNYIVPIIEGRTLRIFDSEKKTYEDYNNPANDLKEGRRGAALRFAEEKGATAFASPPQTFCELSYEKAKTDGVQFYPLEESITYDHFVQKVESNGLAIQTELSKDKVAPSF